LLEFDIASQRSNDGLPTPFELTAEQERVQGILRTLYDASALAATEEGGVEAADVGGAPTAETDEDSAGSADADGEGVTEVAGDAGTPTPETVALVANVEKLSDEDRTFLRDELGWFGELALVPEGTALPRVRESTLEPATMVVFIFVGVVIVLCAMGFLGFVGLVMLLIFAAVGKVRSRVLASPAHHGIYAETFAVWLVVFFGAQLVAGLVTSAGGLSTAAGMGLVIAGFGWSLAALAWPVVRGVRWGQVRADIGWTLGRVPVVEPVVGVAGYAMALPLLGIGLLLTLLFMVIEQMFTPEGVGRMFEPMGGPAHPIVLEVAGPDVLPKVMILLLAAVAAPIVEETMFRGVLYRHLRDASRGVGTALSMLFSGMLSGFLFAAIHPQGWVAIPALMSLAWAFVILREWRGSVVPAMVVHGISNGLVMTLLIVLLGLG
jgi:membrane protease YdiL (CAAX protease family)